MWELELDLIKALEYDEELTEAVLHGREIADICGNPVLDQLRSALTSPDHRRHFASEVARAYRESRIRNSSTPSAESRIDDGTNRLKRIAEAFCIGFVGRWGDDSRIVRYDQTDA
jgi:hypothetical protein